MEKSKAYTPEKPYMCVYETKEDGIGYATFDNKEALMELLNECRENGDKILMPARLRIVMNSKMENLSLNIKECMNMQSLKRLKISIRN